MGRGRVEAMAVVAMLARSLHPHPHPRLDPQAVSLSHLEQRLSAYCTRRSALVWLGEAEGLLSRNKPYS